VARCPFRPVCARYDDIFAVTYFTAPHTALGDVPGISELVITLPLEIETPTKGPGKRPWGRVSSVSRRYRSTLNWNTGDSLVCKQDMYLDHKNAFALSEREGYK
jgi:hypothetical protein